MLQGRPAADNRRRAARALALLTPTVLGAGHGAMQILLVSNPRLAAAHHHHPAQDLASAISLGSGFRGGLFFASLLLGVADRPALQHLDERAVPAQRPAARHRRDCRAGRARHRRSRRALQHGLSGAGDHRRLFGDRGRRGGFDGERADRPRDCSATASRPGASICAARSFAGRRMSAGSSNSARRPDALGFRDRAGDDADGGSPEAVSARPRQADRVAQPRRQPMPAWRRRRTCIRLRRSTTLPLAKLAQQKDEFLLPLGKPSATS